MNIQRELCHLFCPFSLSTNMFADISLFSFFKTYHSGAHLKLFAEGDNCLSGPQIDKMSDFELEKVIKGVTIFYRSSPKHKLRIVKVWHLRKK